MAERIVHAIPRTQRGFSIFPEFHDRLAVAALASWVEPRDDGHKETDFIDLENPA